MPPTSSQIRRWLKWIGTLVCAAIVIIAIIGIWYTISLENHGLDFFEITRGNASLKWQEKPYKTSNKLRFKVWWHSSVRFDFSWPSIRKSAALVETNLGTFVFAPVWETTIPLWSLFILAALPTAFLWWRDRRRHPVGHCRQCGYNLTGNVSGTCPECGTGVTHETG